MIGTDIIEIDRIKKSIETKAFFNRVYTLYEQNYINSKAIPEETAAGIFAAKEAIFKAFGTGIGGELSFLEIEINHKPNGKPKVILNNKASDMLKNMGYKSCEISISHCKSYAVAFCIFNKS